MKKQLVHLKILAPVLVWVFVIAITNTAYGEEPPVFLFKWGSEGTGNGQFNHPSGIEIDMSNNDVYVVDPGNYRIQKFDSNGNFITKWGSEGTADGQFQDPRGISVYPGKYVYVLDQDNHNIQKFSTNGSFDIKWGSIGSGDGQILWPRNGIDAKTGSVYVADSQNHRIQKFDSNGNFITKWGSQGSDDGQFGNFSLGITTDLFGNVYVVDPGNYRIQKFDSNGNFITKWGSEGTADGQFDSPSDIAIDSSGNVYVVEQFGPPRIQKFDSNGNFITKWDSSNSGEYQLSQPLDIAVDSLGNVYVSNWGTHEILVFGQDVLSPSFTNIPQNIETITSDLSGIQVSYPFPSASDNAGTPTVTCNPTSGTKFPVGSTLVICTATDSSGNIATTQFNIVIALSDATKPWFPNPPQNIQQTTMEPSGTTVFYLVPPANDNAGTPTVTCNPTSGTKFPVGSTLVICTATDSSGNIATTQFTVLVDFSDPTPQPESKLVSDNGRVYEIKIDTESTINNVEFVKEQKSLFMSVEGPTGTPGSLTVEIPRHIIDNINDVRQDERSIPFEIETTSVSSIITVNYHHSETIMRFLGSATANDMNLLPNYYVKYWWVPIHPVDSIKKEEKKELAIQFFNEESNKGVKTTFVLEIPGGIYQEFFTTTNQGIEDITIPAKTFPVGSDDDPTSYPIKIDVKEIDNQVDPSTTQSDASFDVVVVPEFPSGHAILFVVGLFSVVLVLTKNRFVTSLYKI